MGSKNDHKYTRRTAIKGIGSGFLLAISPTVVSANNQTELDPDRVDWSNDESVLKFASQVGELGEEDQLEIVQNLSIDQEKAIVDAKRDMMKYSRSYELKFDKTVPEKDLESDYNIASSGLPTSFNQSVTASEPFGGDQYTFYHTIEWNFTGTEYLNVQSLYDGEAHDWLWSYDGPGASSYVEYDTFFEAMREGIFSSIISSNDARPFIEVRGDQEGYGTLLDKDDDYPP